MVCLRNICINTLHKGDNDDDDDDNDDDDDDDDNNNNNGHNVAIISLKWRNIKDRAVDERAIVLNTGGVSITDGLLYSKSNKN